MRVNLNSAFLATELKVPLGKKRVEFADVGGPAGFYLEVRATSEGQGTYWCRYRRKTDNRLMHHKIGRTTELTLAAARDAAKRIRAQVVLGADPRGAEQQKGKIVSYETFMLESYFPYVEARKRSWRRDEQLWRVHVRDAIGAKRLTEITRQEVQALQTAMVERGLAAATANHAVKLVRYSLRLACEWGYLERNIISGTPMLFEDNQKERYLSDEELNRLLHVLRTDRNRNVCQIVLLLLATGMRLNEVLSATWADVDLEGRVFVVRALNSKSKRVRSVPINDAALEVLDSLDTKGSAGPLFVNQRTGQRYRTIAKQWNRIRMAAGLPEFRIHDCRHFYASALVSSGRTLFETQQILGHSSPIVTQRYSHLSSRALQEAASAASDRLQNGRKAME